MRVRRGHRRDRREARILFFFLLSSSLVPFSPPGSAEEPLRRADLLILGTERPSRVTVGLHLELSPGWYLYWINPGDAGLSPDVTWRVPSGFVPGPLRFPTPQKFVHAGIVAYGYKEEVLIVCEIESPLSSLAFKDGLTLGALLDWMACRESCVAGQEKLEVALREPSAKEKRKAKDVQVRFASRYPRSAREANLSSGPAALLESGAEWKLEIPFSGDNASKIDDFFPYPVADFVIEHGRILCRDGRVIIPLVPSRAGASLTEIGGLFIVGGFGFEARIPVEPKENKNQK